MTTLTHPVPAVHSTFPPPRPWPPAPPMPDVDLYRCAGEYVLCDDDGVQMAPAGGARLWCPRCGRERYGPETPGCPNTPTGTVPTPSGLVAVCDGHRRPGMQLWRSPR
jgi:hypothetical protein